MSVISDSRGKAIGPDNPLAVADGTDGDGIVAPAGATGQRGWLSGVYDRLSKVVLAAGTAVIGKVGLQVGGNDVAAGSPLPVTLPDLTAAGAITTQNLNPSTGAATINSTVGLTLNQVGTVIVQITGVYTGALTPQVTIDGVNWVAMGPAALININSGAYAQTIASASVGIWQMDVAGFAAVRLSANAAVTGTATVTMRASQAAGMIALDNALPAGSNTIGAVTLPAGTNVIGDVGLQARANATGAASLKHIVSLATTNATNVKAAAGRLLGWDLTNTTASWVYIKLHNNAGTPTAGAGVAQTVAIPPNGKASASIPVGIAYGTGIAFTIVTGSADTDATAVTAGAVVGDLFYA
jgi:hypothetical protein